MRFILATLFIGFNTTIFSQQDSEEKLQKLVAPTSPASAIAGMQPTTVLAPKSYNALETALFNNFTDGDGVVIPNDLSIEFTPYWTKSHRLSISDYLYPTMGQSFIRNSSFSVSSTQGFQLGDSSSSNALGLGWRTSIYFYNDDKDTVDKMRNTIAQTSNAQSLINNAAFGLLENNDSLSKSQFLEQMKPILINQFYKNKIYSSITESEKMVNELYADTASLPRRDATDSLYNSFIQWIRTGISGELVFKQFKQYLTNREGLSIDIAVATLVNFPTNDFEFSYAPKTAFWLTPTYRFWSDTNHVLKAMLVYRYEWFNLGYYKSYFPNATVYRNNHDFGVSFAAEFKKCSVQFELVGRASETEIPAGTDAEGRQLYVREKDDDLQYMLVLNYRLTDQIVLTYNFGNRFDPVLNPDHTLVSTLSLNFGFGAPKKASIDLMKPRK